MTTIATAADKSRFDAAWAAAQDEYDRLMRLHGVPSRVPETEWTEYERLRDAAGGIAAEFGELGSPRREELIYGPRI